MTVVTVTPQLEQKGEMAMRTTLKRMIFTLLIFGMLVIAKPLLAVEGGVTHYVPGAMATMIDLAPTDPGWVLLPAYMHYQGEASASGTIPTAGLVTAGLDATSDAVLMGGFYTLPKQVFGAFYTVGAFLPYVWMDVEARVDSALGSVQRSQTNAGLGDITVIPAMLAWESDFWQYTAALPIFAPTGEFEVGSLANTGLNYWTFDPTVGVSYNNEKNGFNWAIYGGLSLSTENSDTNYQTGALFHLDGSVQQLLPTKLGIFGIGAEAFYLEQIEGDSGEGARLGDFKGRTTGIGPVLSYLVPGEHTNFMAELRWLPELDVKNRMEGDYIWLKLAWQF
jgi:hypothetical protein